MGVLEWNCPRTFNIKALVESPVRETSGLFQGPFEILAPQMYILPSLLGWIPGPHQEIFLSFAELQVFISEQTQQRFHYFLDQMDEVQDSAALNSIQAAYKEVPGTWWHPSSLSAGKE